MLISLYDRREGMPDEIKTTKALISWSLFSDEMYKWYCATEDGEPDITVKESTLGNMFKGLSLVESTFLRAHAYIHFSKKPGEAKKVGRFLLQITYYPESSTVLDMQQEPFITVAGWGQETFFRTFAETKKATPLFWKKWFINQLKEEQKTYASLGRESIQKGLKQISEGQNFVNFALIDFSS